MFLKIHSFPYTYFFHRYFEDPLYTYGFVGLAFLASNCILGRKTENVLLFILLSCKAWDLRDALTCGKPEPQTSLHLL